MTLYIGDVHGKYRHYKRILNGCKNSIQVGDLGVGFRRTSGAKFGEYDTNPPHYKMVEGGHRFIRGNHDNPDICRHHSQWIKDGRVENDTMFVGGARSTDRFTRIEGYSWWADEELIIKDFGPIIDVYLMAKPRIMVTHDCPNDVASIVIDGIVGPSRTTQAFQAMWSLHSPDLWIFGHHHRSFDAVMNGTRFVCLAELETKELD